MPKKLKPFKEYTRADLLKLINKVLDQGYGSVSAGLQSYEPYLKEKDVTKLPEEAVRIQSMLMISAEIVDPLHDLAMVMRPKGKGVIEAARLMVDANEAYINKVIKPNIDPIDFSEASNEKN